MINFSFAVLIFVIIADLFQIYSPFLKKTQVFFELFEFFSFPGRGAGVFPPLFFIGLLIATIYFIIYII